MWSCLFFSSARWRQRTRSCWCSLTTTSRSLCSPESICIRKSLYVAFRSAGLLRTQQPYTVYLMPSLTVCEDRQGDVGGLEISFDIWYIFMNCIKPCIIKAQTYKWCILQPAVWVKAKCYKFCTITGADSRFKSTWWKICKFWRHFFRILWWWTEKRLYSNYFLLQHYMKEITSLVADMVESGSR